MITTTSSPFFILGNPRSGTTLLRLMLDAHPNILVPPECGFAVWYYSKYVNLNYSDDLDAILESFIKDLKKAKKIESWKLDYEQLLKYLQNQLPQNYAELISSIYNYYGRTLGNSDFIWGDKNNFYIEHIKELIKIFPKAKFIHIIRDGRDVACSYLELNSKVITSKYAPILETNITKIAKEWVENNSKIRDDITALSLMGDYLCVKYEDIINRSKDSLTLLTNFLGLEYSDDMINYHRITKTNEPVEFLQWKAKTTMAPTSESIGRYQRDLTPNEIEIFNEVAKSVILKYGYCI